MSRQTSLTEKKRIIADYVVAGMLTGLTKTDAMRKAAESVGISFNYVREITYQPIVNEYIEIGLGKKEPPDVSNVEYENLKERVDAVSVGWVIREFKSMYGKLSDDDAKERQQKIDILDKFQKMLDKFQSQMSGEAEAIRTMPYEELLQKFYSTSKVILKEKASADMFVDLIAHYRGQGLMP